MQIMLTVSRGTVFVLLTTVNCSFDVASAPLQKFLLARFLQVDGPTTENPLQEVLAPWKNDLIDKVLDAGLLAELLDERHYIPYVLVWKLMQLNLTHRPSSRHAGKTTSFTNIISLTGRVGHTHETYPFVVFQPEKWSQNLWMVYEYA